MVKLEKLTIVTQNLKMKVMMIWEGGWWEENQTISGKTTITKTNRCEGHEKTVHSGNRLFSRVYNNTWGSQKMGATGTSKTSRSKSDEKLVKIIPLNV